MRTLEFHSEAQRRIDDLATEIKSLLTVRRKSEQTLSKPTFQPYSEFHNVLVVGPDQSAGPSRYQVVNPITLELEGLSFQCGDQLLELTAGNMHPYRKLIQILQSNQYISEKISETFLESFITENLCNFEEGYGVDQFSKFLEIKLPESVEQLEIWIPLSGILIAQKLSLGPVQIRMFEKVVIDHWYEQSEKGLEGDRITFLQEWFEKFRSEYQGYAAGVIKMEAEENKAIEIAINLVEKACRLLRIFHYSALNPYISCHCVPKGMEHSKSEHAFIINTQGHPREQSRLTHKAIPRWDISEATIQHLNSVGLQHAVSLFSSPRKSNFEKTLWHALKAYSRVMLVDELEWKIINLFLSLEIMLIAAETEPIQSNIAERFGIILFGPKEDARKVSSLVKQCYKFRSQYLHHGRKEIDAEVVRDLMGKVWLFYRGCIRNREKFHTKRDFLKYIDDLKYNIAVPRLSAI